MRTVFGLLLVVAIVESIFVFAPMRVAPPLAPTAAYRQAKAEALFSASFKQFSSAKVDLAPLRGQALLVFFWASWCAECRDEAKALMALRARHAGDGLAVIGIGIDQSDQLQRVVREQGIDYPVFVAGQDGIELSRKLGNLLGELPFTAAIDRHGLYAASQLGKAAPTTLDALAAAALK